MNPYVAVAFLSGWVGTSGPLGVYLRFFTFAGCNGTGEVSAKQSRF